jgi:hypothetical protein
MMDYAHVSQALVMGMPFVKKWSANDPARGRYYLDNDSPVTLARETDYTIAEAILDYRKMSSSDKGKEISCVVFIPSSADSMLPIWVQ